MKATAYQVWNTTVLDIPEMRALLDRAFADGKFDVDPEEMRAFLQRDLDPLNPWLLFWLATHPQHGLCGFMLITYVPTPVSPNPCIAHFHVDVPEAREPLLVEGFKWAVSKGLRHCTIVNATGRSDAAHARLFRRFGRARRRGSLMVYDLGERA